MFICKDCGAFYCEKCTHALINLENACWVCDTPFDKSKPVKPYKREEEGVTVEEKIQKSSNDMKEFRNCINF